MKKILVTIATIGLLLPVSSAIAETDWSQVDAAIGKKAAVIGAVHKYGLPRRVLSQTFLGG